MSSAAFYCAEIPGRIVITKARNIKSDINLGHIHRRMVSVEEYPSILLREAINVKCKHWGESATVSKDSHASNNLQRESWLLLFNIITIAKLVQSMSRYGDHVVCWPREGRLLLAVNPHTLENWAYNQSDFFSKHPGDSCRSSDFRRPS